MRARVIRIFLPLCLLAAGLLLPACGQDAVELLHGSWVCDVRATLELIPDAQGMSEEQKDKAETMFGTLRLDFDVREHTVTTHIGPLQRINPYSILARQGQVIEMQARDRYRITMLDQDTLLLADDTGFKLQLVLRRIQPDQ